MYVRASDLAVFSISDAKSHNTKKAMEEMAGYIESDLAHRMIQIKETLDRIPTLFIFL